MMKKCSVICVSGMLSVVVAIACVGNVRGDEPLPATVEFNRDIRPILADTCFTCHGPDQNKREAKLRLDTEEGARANREDGKSTIVAGKPDESEIIRRITATNADERMPPAESNKTLSPRQIALVRKWVEQGAPWQKHWSLIPPVRHKPPAVAREEWVRNPVDRFILARQQAQNVTPSADADRRTLIRRAYFDLIGLPPSPEQVDTFVADPSPQAFEKVVDGLLASDQFGERMAVYWLDVVRYSDTAGYHSDNHRDLAPYRDYVIQAFLKNKPFDQFLTEQLAGDLLPNATNESRVASGFNRLLQTTEEGGAQPKEYTAKYAADRVRNSSVIWLGLTMGCCECHDHKYDPLSTRDFYSMEAFFADVAETAVGRQAQTAIPTPEQERLVAELDQKLAAARGEYEKPSPELDAEQAKWEATVRADIAANKSQWAAVKPEKVESLGGQTLTVQDDLSVLAAGTSNPDKDTYTVTLRADRDKITGIRLETLTHDSLANKGLSRANGNFVLTQFEVEVASGADGKPQPVKLVSAEADFSQDKHPIALAIDGKADTGWAIDGHVKPADHKAVFVFEKPITSDVTTVLTIRLRHDSIHPKHNIGRFRLSLTSADKPSVNDLGLPTDIVAAVKVEAAQQSPEQKQAVAKYFRTVAPLLAPLRTQIAELEKQREATVKAFPQTLVTTAAAPRMVRILPRGNWLDDSGEVVEPATPGSLNPFGVSGRRGTRLDLAQWMTAPENPLVARVFVNRLWKICFGQGIVKSIEDFGTQGDWPTHPELLDWLAVEFRESGWNVKHVLKLMVMSHTYQQSSQADKRLKELDPNNRLLARQNRFRLDAEFVRDNALAISGLLSKKMYGPSVKPYQPAGYWSHLNFPVREWQNDKGDELYRRGLYTYWCRTFLYPSFVAFDAPSREECTADRPRSNTPLQALALLNDTVYVEAARVFATRILQSGGATDSDRLTFAYRAALQRPPRDEELKTLAQLVEKHRQQYTTDKAAAAELLKVGEAKAPDTVDPAELAAWTSAARVILNLHETITRN